MAHATTGLVPQAKFNEQKMTSLMSEREESGISVKDFCKLRHITEATYYYWRKKLLNKNDPPPGDRQPFAMLHFKDEVPHDLFCELTTVHGGRLRFYQPVPASFLQSLI